MNFIYDKNFDKFEMYSLRNIFRIPDDLGDKTKVDIDISSSSSSSDDKTHSEADEKNIDNKRYQLLQKLFHCEGKINDLLVSSCTHTHIYIQHTYTYAVVCFKLSVYT